MESLRLLPHPAKKIFLTLLNSCFLSATAPEIFRISKVIMIYKGNNKCSRAASSYRPISLANSIYKLYAILLHSRLSRILDPFL